MARVFVSYSHKDEVWKDRVVCQLGVLSGNRLETWDDRRIEGGDDWLGKIEQAIALCDVALLLISANFLTSKFILGQEVPALMERLQEDGIRVIPVILSPCQWVRIPWMKSIQVRPRDGKPLGGMSDNDAETALSDLVGEIFDLSEKPPPTLTRRRADALAQTSNPDPEHVLALVQALKPAGEYDSARHLLENVRARLPDTMSETGRKNFAQEQALCTYEDVYLPVDKRDRAALAILKGIGLHDPECRDAKTLTQGGTIYKRMWESSGEIEHLHTALAFYLSAWQRDPEHDQGWGGVNAAYLLDLLASRGRASATRTGTVPAQAEGWEAQARDLRRELLDTLPSLFERHGKSNDYWGLATLAEIYFGLEEYGPAGEWLARAAQTEPLDWMRQVTTRQLVNLARLHRVPPPGPEETQQEWHVAWRVLAKLLGNDTSTALNIWRGKVGLALAGIGFRASLFHLGMLARLAECDILRNVETLSTVSGGSIVGAHYYLALRHLLQTRPDQNIERRDYVELVRGLIDDTLRGVQRNLLLRTYSNLWANLKMLFSNNYSRSMRMGELYEKHLFSQVKDEHSDGSMRRLRTLPVYPATAVDATRDPDSTPEASNWLRRAKVPNLVLNATSLNSGHIWRFTTRWMGEQPKLTGEEIDVNERYRPLYYAQAPSDALRDFPLAYAVAASSCEPYQFEPVSLEGLYYGRTIRLVDGSVHDTRGMAALLDDGCDFILSSDASGQMESQDAPANGMLGVLVRSNSILQDRVRDAQYQAINAQADSGAVKGLFFINMKHELRSELIDYVGSQPAQHETNHSTCTSYGVDRELQRLISDIRTDLDSFTEVESFALMASGYLMTDSKLRELDCEHTASGLSGTWGGFHIGAPMWRDAKGGAYWPFAPLIPILAKSGESADRRRRDLGIQLKAGSIMFGRVWRLVGWLRKLAIVGAISGSLEATIWIWENHYTEIAWEGTISVGTLATALMLALVVMIVPLKYLNPRKVAQSWLLVGAVAMFGWAASNLHLLLFEPLLKRRGSLHRLLK